MARVRVLVADEQALFREGLCALLRSHEDIEVVGQAADGHEAIEKARMCDPDVVLMDMALPVVAGAEVIRRIRVERESVKVLLVSQHEDRERVLTGLRSGANGYIPRRAATSELFAAIMAVHRGDFFLHPSVARTVTSDYLRHIKYPDLTPREKEVLRLMAAGHNSEQIAELLHIAANTVMAHRTGIRTKLGIHNRTEILKYAIRKNLVNLDG